MFRSGSGFQGQQLLGGSSYELLFFFVFVFSSDSIVALLSEIHEQKLQDLLVRTSLSHSRKRSIRASPIVEHAYSATAV